MHKDLTQGSVLKNIILFSLPYFLSYFLQTLYGLADLFIVGQFDGVDSITAVSIGSQIMHMITVMIVGLSMGATVCIAQACGAKDSEKLRYSIGNTVTVFFILSLLLTCLLLFFTDTIADLVKTPEEAVLDTREYLVICFAGIPLITAYNIVSSVLRGLGDSKSPMYFIAIACVANIFLDYLFIGYFKLGATGAALGTTIAQGISVVCAFFYIRKNNSKEAFSAAYLKLKGNVAKRLLRIGIPICAQDGFIQTAFMIITVIANMRGLTDAAAVGIVEKIISFIFLVPSSMLSTVSAMGAQNIGAGFFDRAKLTLRYAIFITAAFGLTVGIVFQFMSENALELFTKDRDVVISGGKYLQGYIWDCLFAGISFSFSGFFCALGKSEISFMHNLIATVTLRVPGAYIASVMFPATLLPMGLATASGSLLSAVICTAVYRAIEKKDQIKFTVSEN